LGVIRTAVSDILVDLATGAPPTKAFAMTTLPGHHSSSVSFGGYCYVNFAAVAAKMFRTKLDKVAIVGARM
jgi:acetoin utilization deacetylase AcuC-like enzyme